MLRCKGFRERCAFIPKTSGHDVDLHLGYSFNLEYLVGSIYHIGTHIETDMDHSSRAAQTLKRNKLY